MTLQDFALQLLLAALYYFGLIGIVRLAGKRLAGQTTTFDLIILISLGVTLQSLTLNPGRANALIFILTVFLFHIGVARLSAKYPWLRSLTREEPRPLIQRGQIVYEALKREGVTEEELNAALRRQGVASAEDVHLAVLEETGHISAIRNEPG